MMKYLLLSLLFVLLISCEREQEVADAATPDSGCPGNYLAARDAFVENLQYDTCDHAIPICSYSAGCRLEHNSNYISIDFPSSSTFVVNAANQQEIVISILVSRIAHKGSQTTVRYFETGCSSFDEISVNYNSLESSLCLSQPIEVVHRVSSSGDHLIDLLSDNEMNALVKISAP